MKKKRTFSTGVKAAIIIASATVIAAFIAVLPHLYKKTSSIQQTIEKSPGSFQAGRDINILVESKSADTAPVARFPFDIQVKRVKERIRYLSEEYLKIETLSLVEVTGPYGDNILDSPQLYDWEKVMKELQTQGYIKILRQTGKNIQFKVLKRISVKPNDEIDFLQILDEARKLAELEHYGEACRRYQQAMKILPDGVKRKVKLNLIKEAETNYNQNSFHKAAKLL